MKNNDKNKPKEWLLHPIKRSPGAIQSYLPISAGAGLLVDELICYAINAIRVEGVMKNFMPIQNALKAMGLNTRNFAYIRDRINEIQNIKAFQWDLLGKEETILRAVKDKAKGNLDKTIERVEFSATVNTRLFSDFNKKRLELEASIAENRHKPEKSNALAQQSKELDKVVDHMLDLLFPIVVGNVGLFSTIDLHKNFIGFSLNEKLIPFFMDPMVYTTPDRRILRQLGQYGRKFYENGLVYHEDGETPWLSIDEAKYLLSVSKNPKNLDEFRYPRYSSFKKDVLQVGMKEIDSCIDIPFSVEVIEDSGQTPGKSVDRIKFIFHHKSTGGASFEIPQMILPLELLEESSVENNVISKDEIVQVLSAKLVALGMSPPSKNVELIRKIAEKHSYDYIHAQIEYCKEVNAKRVKDGETVVLGGYVRNALLNNYAKYYEASPSSRNNISESPDSFELLLDSEQSFDEQETKLILALECAWENKHEQIVALIQKDRDYPFFDRLAKMMGRPDLKGMGRMLLRTCSEAEFRELIGVKTNFSTLRSVLSR